MNSCENPLIPLAKSAREASFVLSSLSRAEKDAALCSMADALESNEEAILNANGRDMRSAEEKGVPASLLDRLRLTPERVRGMAEGLRKVASLEDPVGQVMDSRVRPNGLSIMQVRVPIGVIGMIYESRPNVTADAAGLCLKTGNAVLLKGGSDALHSNRVIARILQEAVSRSGLPAASIQLIDSADRSSVIHLCRLEGYLDLLIPRGGRSLIETVVENARVPVIKHYDGICHLYVDASADLTLAVDLADDAKTQRPGACNAIETLLVHESVAPAFLPLLAERMRLRGTELRGCPRALPYLGEEALAAGEQDWLTEYLDYILAVKVVDSLEEAMAHINHYSSHHSDAIAARDVAAAEKFLSGVHSACVYHNASTRFSDGEEYGFGAEIGISTDKLHARGPMGLRELTSYQYRVRGAGQVKDSSRQSRG